MDGKNGELSAEGLALAIQRVRRGFMRENLAGMEALAAQALVLLVAEPGLSLKQCAERLSAGQSNVSTAVSRLVDEGFAQSKPSRADPRIRELTATALGKARVREFVAAASVDQG